MESREQAWGTCVCCSCGGPASQPALPCLPQQSSRSCYPPDPAAPLPPPPPLQIIDDTTFSVNGKPIKVVSSRDPTQLPWKEMDIDLVIEGTGVFIDTKGASKHLEAGAKKVGGRAGLSGWGDCSLRGVQGQGLGGSWQRQFKGGWEFCCLSWEDSVQ